MAVWNETADGEKRMATINGLSAVAMPDKFNDGYFGFMVFGAGGEVVAKRFMLTSMGFAQAMANAACNGVDLDHDWRENAQTDADAPDADADGKRREQDAYKRGRKDGYAQALTDMRGRIGELEQDGELPW